MAAAAIDAVSETFKSLVMEGPEPSEITYIDEFDETRIAPGREALIDSVKAYKALAFDYPDGHVEVELVSDEAGSHIRVKNPRHGSREHLFGLLPEGFTNAGVANRQGTGPARHPCPTTDALFSLVSFYITRRH